MGNSETPPDGGWGLPALLLLAQASRQGRQPPRIHLPDVSPVFTAGPGSVGTGKLSWWAGSRPGKDPDSTEEGEKGPHPVCAGVRTVETAFRPVFSPAWILAGSREPDSRKPALPGKGQPASSQGLRALPTLQHPPSLQKAGNLALGSSLGISQVGLLISSLFQCKFSQNPEEIDTLGAPGLHACEEV